MIGDRPRVGLAALVIALVALATSPTIATAHPLGNFSINRYSALQLSHDLIELRYIVDMAEIPTFQEVQESGLTVDAEHPSVAAYAARKAETLKGGLAVLVNGRRLVLETVSRSVIFPPGAGGLPTLKIGIRYRAHIDEHGERRIDYRDGNFAERAGWKEIVAAGGPGWRIVESSVPERDRSRELSDYPTDLLASPPQTVEAHVAAVRESPGVVLASALNQPSEVVRPSVAATRAERAARPVRSRESIDSTAVVPPSTASHASDTRDARAETLTLAPNRQATPRNAFTELVTTRQLSLGIVLFSLLVAAGFGAFHALEPGHGKTVVAAYLVGARGTAWHALILGLIVTASHTAGVYLLGGVALYAQRYIVPERLYPWIGVVSGLTIAVLGSLLFLRRYAGHHHHDHHHHDHDDHRHDHADGHAHDHHDDHAHDHEHGHAHHHVPRSGDVSPKELFALGVTGGIVPCPAALVVLLGALSLGRVAFGLILIAAFSVGLAAVLIAIGVLMVYARRVMARFQGEGPLITRWLPLTSSAVLALIGMAIALQALMAAGIVTIRI